MKKKNNTSFQLCIDAESVFISQVPDGRKSRIIIGNLNAYALDQIAKGIADAGLAKELIGKLADELSTEPIDRTMYTLFLGLDEKPDDDIDQKIKEIVSEFTNSFTLVPALGYFNNNEEFTMLIHIGVEHKEVAVRCAEKLRVVFGQEGVGITEENEYRRVIHRN